MQVMSELADEGLRMFLDPSGEQSVRLREISSYCRFIDKEFPALLDRWIEEWEKERNS